MSITVLNYMDQTLVDSVTTAAAERAAAEKKAAEEAALSTNSDFSTVLNESSQSYSNTESASNVVYPEDLDSIFEEAANTYGVSSDLLKAIAKAESGFNANAVSHAGAVGIMQLMPATAASLGVSNSYNPYENIMGGAKLISQLLIKYNGNTSLALAAYNAGSGNVDKYGGIPPFTETQNYVRKVLSYLNGTFSTSSEASGLVDNTTSELTNTLQSLLSRNGLSQNVLDLLVSLLNQSTGSSAASTTGSTDSAATDSTDTSTDTDESVISSVDYIIPETTVPVITVPTDDTTPAEEVPVEEIPTEEVPVEEAPTEEIPVEEVPAEEIPAEEIPVVDTAATGELPVEEIPSEEISAKDTTLEENTI